MLGAFVVRNVDCNEIACFKKSIRACGNFNGRIKTKRICRRKVGIETDNVHTEVNSCVCYKYTDRAETDDTESLFGYFMSDECLLTAFNCFGKTFAALKSFHPLDAVDKFSSGHEQSRNNQFFYCVCVGAGSIEYYDPAFCVFVYRDIVRTCTCARNCKNGIRQCIFMHIERADYYRVRFIRLHCELIIRLQLFFCKFADIIKSKNSFFHHQYFL